jgi:predicted ATP-dependent protease
MIEHSARLAADADRLSCDKRRTLDVLREADHLAAAASREIIIREDISAALRAQVRRADRLRDEVKRHALKNIQLIATSGTHVAQINGLSVIDLGDFAFGHPVRITATARVGEGEVIDIERETELGGPFHSKGVLILGSFLAMRYSHNLPLSLSASLVFEQSYGEVEGDSASLAELCALLSALCGAPIKQSLAVTGSVNQHGRVQAIGGVNEKVEGFFDLCAARGLSCEQGVILPAANVAHLMLREDVVEAISTKQFHLYAVSDVDQAIELLTGIDAGVPDSQGTVSPGSINYRVASQMATLAAMRQAFASPKEKPRRKRHER